MPESITDRPTKSHEYLFLLSPSPRYFFDAEAVREAGPTTRPDLLAFGEERPDVGHPGHSNGRRRSKKPDGWATHAGGHGSFHRDGREAGEAGTIRPGRNLRSVWTIATEPYPGAHFATFPRKLVEPCIRAGTSERGVCPDCGAPWVRVVERTPMIVRPSAGRAAALAAGSGSGRRDTRGTMTQAPGAETTGWRPTCAHAAEPVPATVLDPFGGSGTTGAVAQSLGRRAVLIELNPEYIAQALARIGAARGRGDGPAVDVPVPFAGDGLWSDEVPA
jgi:hypothetical protein